ncbi:hypothetical protein GQ457_14G020120 [Hibiscus cannabinus]
MKGCKRVSEEWRSRKMKIVSTLFVCNIPEKFHWKGLWAAFGHHGDVVDAFIPNKRTYNGKRFDFIRFATREDADRAMSRLHGFVLFGSKIEVSYSKYEQRTSYWKKVGRSNIAEKRKDELKINKPGQSEKQRKANIETNLGGAISGKVLSQGGQKSGKNLTKGLVNPKVRGCVVEETLWRLQQCFIGFTQKELDSSSVHEDLCKNGLGEIKIKKMVGRTFLLEVEDKILLRSLQDSKWEQPGNIFCTIQPWEDDFCINDRVAWIKVIGIPLHCWCYQTFKNIAGVWGDLLQVEENEFQSMGAEHVTLTITTSQMERINGEVTLEVGKSGFLVGVSEITGKTPYVLAGKDKHIPAAGLKFATPSASSSGSSSFRVERPACSGFGIGNTINMIFNDGACSEGGVNSRVAERLKGLEGGIVKQKHLSWADIVKHNGASTQDQRHGANSQPSLYLDINLNPSGACIQSAAHLEEPNSTHIDLTRLEQRGKSGHQVGAGDSSSLLDPVHEGLAIVEVEGKGNAAGHFKESGLETDKVHEVSDCELGLAPAVQNWADSIDELNNNNHSMGDRAEDYQESSDVEVPYNKDNMILEEHHRVVSGKSKRKKKYGSLYSLQDRVLSEADRRKRDRALRKLKKQNCEDELSADIDEASLTSSDLRGRWKILTRNAIELLEFGSRVGFQVEGDMNMAVSELARAMDRAE